MKRFILCGFFSLAGCATVPLNASAPEPADATAAVAPVAPEPSKPCDARCLEQRRTELDRLLKLGTPAVTVADSRKR